MTKKEIEILAQESYTGNALDEGTVIKFASYMDRKHLKTFIRELKKIEKNTNVVIALPNQTSYTSAKENFKHSFKGKHLILQEDTSLLAGVRIVNNDMVYEQSLKHSLDEMIQTIENRYE